MNTDANPNLNTGSSFILDNDKLENAIQHLRKHYSNIDNLDSPALYSHFASKAELDQTLDAIQDSIDYLESLIFQEFMKYTS